MFTLIKREIEDNWHLAIILSLVTSGMIFLSFYQAGYSDVISIADIDIVIRLKLMAGTVALCFLSAAFGSQQISADGIAKISTFLLSLSVNRRRIFTARVITGFLLTGFAVVCAWAADCILMKNRTVIGVGGSTVSALLAGYYFVTFLAVFACYCFTMTGGGIKNQAAQVFFIFIPVYGFMWLVLVKGHGTEVMVILASSIVCCLVYAWQKFASASL